MHNIEDKSTLKYVSSLMGLFVVGFIILIVTHLYFLNLEAGLDEKTKNQESKIKISGFIIEDLAKIRSSFFEMSAGTSNEIGIKLFYKEIQKSVKDISVSLNVLENGGMLNRDIALNLVNKSNTNQQINYTIDDPLDIVFIREIGILSKLSDLMGIVDELSTVLYLKNKNMKENNFQLVKTIKKIKRINKTMPSFFNRIHEDINKIILHAESKLKETKLEIASKKKQYQKMELMLILTTLLISFFFASKISKQIFAMHKKLRDKSKKLHAILDSTDNMVIVTDGNKINLGNDTFLDFFGYSSIELFSQAHNCICEKFLVQEDYFSLSLIQEDGNWIEYMQKLSDAKKIVSILDRDNQPKSFSVNIKEHKGEEYKYVISFADITDIKIESKRYEKLATFDSLTKIYNRQKFSEIFDYELKRKKRYGGDLSLIILDIDYFKKVNDTYGHDVGDRVLINFAKIIKENIRIQDTFARWGGEEFMILLPKTDIDGVMLVAEKLRSVIELNNQSDIPKITASFGVTQIKSDDSQKSAFMCVDEALYEAKNSGRNCVILAHESELVV